MKLIKPYYKIISEIKSEEMIKSIEVAGRTCYKSEDKITEESAEEFIKMLLKKGHESVLEHEKISILFVCDRGISHELVRHRLASFSQESTRYCNYSKDKFENQITFILPYWVQILPGDYIILPDCAESNNGDEEWISMMLDTEETYINLISKGWQPQQARSVLPNALKTEVFMTANLREWRLILKQRISKAAHPQMRELMCPLLDELKILIPIIFNDINY